MARNDKNIWPETMKDMASNTKNKLARNAKTNGQKQLKNMARNVKNKKNG